MASQDNQVTQTTGTETTTDVIRNVTGYIHFNKDDDLTKIFETLHTFRTSHRLKYYHHRHDFIFFSVKSDCLTELAKVQPFKISHYSSKSTYTCTKEVADKLISVRDSFVRTSWDEETGTVQFLSRTIGRVHNELVQRVFKTVDETFDRSSYHFIPHIKTEGETAELEETEHITQPVRANYTSRGGGHASRGGGHASRGGGHTSRGGRSFQQDASDGFTRVGRDKSKYNKNRVQVDAGTPGYTRAPRGRGGGRGASRESAPEETYLRRSAPLSA